MSLYDKASLVQIPSGTKDGTLYSVLPANGDGDFTHTRASSATRVNKDGLIESVASGVPRLDYPLLDGVVQSCPALLLEPSRTNSFPESNDFSTWSSNRLDLTSDNLISPDGSQNADKVAQQSGFTSAPNINYAGWTAGTYTISIFAKKGTWNYLAPSFNGVSYFNLNTGTIDTEHSNHSASIEYYGNGWYRCVITATVSTTTTAAFYFAEFNNTLTTTDTQGYMYIYGAQIETGSYETSYIPTSGSTVTRNADECNGAGTSAEFNDSEGVLFAEISALANSGGNRRLSINDNVADNDRVLIGFTSTDNQIQGQSRTGTSTQAALDHTVPDATIPNKVAMKYKANDFALWINGFEVDTDTNGTAPAGLIRLSFDRTAGANDFYGNTKQLMTFNEALTDSELEQITSWRSFDEMAKGQLYTIE